MVTLDVVLSDPTKAGLRRRGLARREVAAPGLQGKQSLVALPALQQVEVLAELSEHAGQAARPVARTGKRPAVVIEVCLKPLPEDIARGRGVRRTQ